MAAPQFATETGLALAEPEESEPIETDLELQKPVPFWLVCARRREKLRRHAPSTVAARLPRVERVEPREIHGQAVPVQMCNPASCENPIDLDRDAREDRAFLPSRGS